MTLELIIKLLPALIILVLFLPDRLKGAYATLVTVAGGIIYGLAAIFTLLDISVPLLLELKPLAALFVIAISISTTSATIFATSYLKKFIGKKTSLELAIHYIALITLTYSMLYVLMATDRFEFLLWWEIMTLSSFILILFDGVRKNVLHAAVGYLILMHIGFFVLMMAFYSQPGDELFGYGAMPTWVWILFLIGFGLKAGIFPLHIWLPVTHPAAPAHVSAIMSAVMIKMGVYGIIMVTLGAVDLLTCGYILLGVGIVTGIYGITRASIQNDLKCLLAYSSIENIGIIIAAIGVGAIAKASANMPLAAAATAGALIHLVNHACYKTSLFLGAGAIIKSVHTSNMEQLGGLFKRMPVTGWVLLLSTLAICAIPPFSGFYGEFTILSGLFKAITSNNDTLVAILMLTTLAIIAGMTIITFVKAFSATMLGNPRSDAAKNASEITTTMKISYILPVLAIIFGGVLFSVLINNNTIELFSANNPQADTQNSNTMWIIIVSLTTIIVATLLFVLKRYLQRNRIVKQEPTWGCAFTAPDSQMQYGPSSTTAEIEDVVNNNKNHNTIVDNNDLFPKDFEDKNVKSKERTNSIITNFITHSLRYLTAHLALFQTGKTNQYVLHALIYIIIILALSVIGLL